MSEGNSLSLLHGHNESISPTSSTKVIVTQDKIDNIKKVLLDKEINMNDRYRAVFTLRNLGGKLAIDALVAGFCDESALLKHEIAYALGQMQDTYAVKFLTDILCDENENTMVRHEAGEALGAIGANESIEVLERFVNIDIPEISETCILSIARIQYQNEQINNIKNNNNDDNNIDENITVPGLGLSKFHSVDPAPPLEEYSSIEDLKETLSNENNSLFDRYRALFTLRDIADEESIDALCYVFKSGVCGSSLLKHEVAYVLGQIQHPHAVNALKDMLEKKEEHPMVRHEAAEALGAIATNDAENILKNFIDDEEQVVSESCKVALDISDYVNSEEFQFCDTLEKEIN
eukprot:TRINITY_DN15091_c0_g1_i1.p1 TRINITY_DN15091_c0_g1~~TRINITY_DN15091_c0_g1_i1.p1  ORF type:complete len:348 (+),score=137.49 TRINITY_DN15091_c0_g1_i1:88-1131(+)